MKKRMLSILLCLAMALSCLLGTVMAQSENKLTMYYDDHMDVSGKNASIVDAGTPTSYQVGYGIAEGTRDTAVLTLDGDTLIATGAGTAQVRLGGTVYDVTVTAAPISLFLLMGQSTMDGGQGNRDQSVVCPDGMVYGTYGANSMTAATAANYAPSALTGSARDINVNGTTTGISSYPVHMYTEAGSGKVGLDSGFGYEWAKSSGEKVWLVNAAHNGSYLNSWQPGAANYNEAVALFSACQDTLRAEVAAGHFTLSHMGYFWVQGAGQGWMTAKEYAEPFLVMHESFKKDLAADMDNDPSTPDQTLEFAHLLFDAPGAEGPIGYRFGGMESKAPGHYTTYKLLEARGHRVAYLWMTANPELPDIRMVCNIAETWKTMPDGTDGVKEYFERHYPNGVVNYPVQVRQRSEWYRPTKAEDMIVTDHYSQIAYNEFGRESARNSLILLGMKPDTDEPTTVSFKNWTGWETVSTIEASPVGHTGTLVIPVVEPCYRAKSITYKTSAGLTYDYYDLLADDYETTGTLTAVGANDVQVSVVADSTESYRWDMEPDGTLANSKAADKYPGRWEGTVTNGLLSSVMYTLGKPMSLRHDNRWALEWKMSGSWGSAVKLFSDTRLKNVNGSVSIMINGTAGELFFAEYTAGANQRYGVSLDGIDLTQEHIFRLVNRVESDENIVVLFVDGEEIGTMPDWVSGKDFTFGWLGAEGYKLNNGIIEHIEVMEDKADETTHFHTFDTWADGVVPTATDRGTRVGTCADCKQTVTREVLGSWKIYYVDNHLQKMPEQVYAQTNLADTLPDVYGYYKMGLDWSNSLRSVTMEINPGEKIYSSSFGEAGTNGSDDTNGCYLTFWSPYGLSKYMSAAEVYAEFTAHGYVTAPDDAVIANVALWSNDGVYERLNKVQLLDRPSGYVPQEGDVFYIPGRVLEGCIGEGYVIASENEELTVGELVPVVIPANTSGANNTFGGSWDHFWEMKGGKLNRVSGAWYSTTKFVYGYHDTITGLTDTTLSIAHAVGHTGATSSCGWNFDAACGNSTAQNRYYECAGTLAIAEDLNIIDLTGHNAKTLSDVKVLTDAGRAVINVYAPDGASSGTGGSNDNKNGLVSGTASVVVVIDPEVYYIPPEGELLLSGDVFFVPSAVTGGKPVEAYVVDSASKKVGSKVTITIPEGTVGANGHYDGRFWEVTNGAVQLIYNVTATPDGTLATAGANRYGYHDRINNKSSGNVIRLQDGLQHKNKAGSSNGCCLGFAESCGVSAYPQTRSAYEVGPYLTFEEGTSHIIDLRAEALADPTKAIDTLEELLVEVSSANNKGGEDGDTLINTYAANAIPTSADEYTTVAGTVTTIVVVDGSSKPEAPTTYGVTVGNVENGTVTVDPTSGTVGDTVTVTATADYGYVLGSILVDGVDVTAEAENGKYIFLIEKDHQVTATFTALPRYTVETTTNGNGTVTLDKDWYVSGGTVTVTLMPKGNYTLLDAQPVDEDTTAVIGAAASGDSYELTKLLVNGEDVTNEVEGNKYTFTIEEDTQIQAEFEKKAAEEVKIVNENMILGNSLAMNFYVLRNSIDPDKDYYIQVTKTFADDRDAVVQRYDEELWKKHNEDGYEYYRVTFDGLAAKEMNDDITVQVFYAADDTAAGPEYTSSPRLYAEKALGYSALSGWWTMFVDMLNYGASAQQHFSYDVEHLANAGLTEAQKAMASGEVTLDTVDRNGGANGYFHGSSLYLEHNIALNLYLKDMSAGMYVQVSFTDHSGFEKNRRIAFEDMLESAVEGVVYHVASVNELAVADCEAAVTVKVYNANGELLDTGMDSVVTYLYKMDETHSDDPLYKNALKFIASAKENV